MPLALEIVLLIIWSMAMYAIFVAFVTIVLTEAWPNVFLKSGFSCLTPKYLHRETKLNWIGAILVGIILHIIYLPIVLIWYLGKIFTKKEKKDERSR